MNTGLRIFHITSRSAWENACAAGEYRAESLHAQGFIHFSGASQVLSVANAFYVGQRGLVLLEVDASRLRAELRWEPPSHPAPGTEPALALFPHLYGPLNPDAVVRVIDFEPGPDGFFFFTGFLL
jgi:uncharacterized protein (DUF952 family)